VTALLLALTLVATATADERSPTAGRRSLAGRLLVATDTLRDPRFARTVIYMVRHTEGGALGLVVNIPIGDAPFDRALEPFGLDVPPGSGKVRVYYGGPVESQRGFVLHTPDWKGQGTLVIDAHFALTEDPKVLQAMARGGGPRRALFCLGYAGWAPGQLDAELGRGAWGIAPADERLVFDEDPQAKWIEATARRLLDL
jgi:putative transcriptional regulator